MKKVIRLTENDVEILVRKIISEEKKSINEGPLKWIRKKYNQDEEVGRLIIKALESGDIEDVRYQSNDDHHASSGTYLYSCDINGHKILAKRIVYVAGELEYITIDGEPIEVSGTTKRKIFKLLKEISKIPDLKKKNKKLGDVKTSLSRYNLSAEERKNLENPDTFFPEDVDM